MCLETKCIIICCDIKRQLDGLTHVSLDLASSEDTIVEYSENTLSALRGKHPAPHARYSYSTSSNPFSSSVLTTTDWFRPSNLFQKVQLVDQIVLDLNFFIT